MLAIDMVYVDRFARGWHRLAITDLRKQDYYTKEFSECKVLSVAGNGTYENLIRAGTLQ